MHRLPQELVAEINGLEALDARALHRHYRAELADVPNCHLGSVLRAIIASMASRIGLLTPERLLYFVANGLMRGRPLNARSRVEALIERMAVLSSFGCMSATHSSYSRTIFRVLYAPDSGYSRSGA